MISIYGKGGNCSLEIVFNNSESCSLIIEKDLKYESWKFSLSILCGVITMFVGLGSYFGWEKDEFIHPKSVPIDNPGEEMKIPEEEPVSEEEDEFRSDDGY